MVRSLPGAFRPEPSSSTCPCGAGKGDCDSDSQCKEGLACVNDVGPSYGYASWVDVCEPSCSGSSGGWAFCTETCPCEIGEGDCDNDSQCLPGLVCKDDIGANYGWDSTMDVCERKCASGVPGGWSFCSPGCPCGEGEGDCDSDDDCAGGLKCVDNVGADYGYPSTMDVCEPLNACDIYCDAICRAAGLC